MIGCGFNVPLHFLNTAQIGANFSLYQCSIDMVYWRNDKKFDFFNFDEKNARNRGESQEIGCPQGSRLEKS